MPKKQYGGFRFRDIITQENLDKHIGKEVEIISLWSEHAKNELDKKTAITQDGFDWAEWRRNLTDNEATGTGENNRYRDLINYTGRLAVDRYHRDNLADIFYPHLVRGEAPHPAVTVPIPTNLHEYFHAKRVGSLLDMAYTYPYLLYLIRLKKPEDILSDAIRAKFALPPRRYPDIFTADNLSRIKRRNIFNPELETRRFINSRKTKKKDSGKKRRFTVTKDSVKYPPYLRTSNLYIEPPLSYIDLLRGKEREKIYLSPDILEILRRSI